MALRPVSHTQGIRRIVSCPAFFQDVINDMHATASYSDITNAIQCEIDYRLMGNPEESSSEKDRIQSLATCIATPPDLSSSSRNIETHVSDVIEKTLSVNDSDNHNLNREEHRSNEQRCRQQDKRRRTSFEEKDDDEDDDMDDEDDDME